MERPIINLDELELLPRPAAYAPTGEAANRYDARAGFISPRLGARKLGYNLTVIMPGMRAFPFHSHQVNEEMFLILEGTGEVRIGDKTFPIRKGDVIAHPPGGPETAHQIINTGKTELKVFSVSTTLSPDIAEYPDTGRFGILADLAPGADGQPRQMRFIGAPDRSLDYWEGN